MPVVQLADPFVILQVNPTTVLALGAGAVSAATVIATGLMGRWFTRMEREARADSAPAWQVTLAEPTLGEALVESGDLGTFAERLSAGPSTAPLTPSTAP